MRGALPQALRPLTARQAHVLDVIRTYVRKHGYPPTIRELGVLLGIRTTNGVNDVLKALEVKGALRRKKARSRTLVLAEKPPPEVATLLHACRVATGLLKLNRAQAAQRVLEAAVANAPTGHGGSTS